MKKINIMILLAITMFPVLALAGPAAGAEVLGGAQQATNETGSMIGTLLFIAVVSIWMLPFVFGAMVYSGQKKKAEQQHEEVGIKAALYALVAIIIGAAAAYYIVGTVGGLAKQGGAGDGTLKEGNAYFLEPLFNKGKTNIAK